MAKVCNRPQVGDLILFNWKSSWDEESIGLVLDVWDGPGHSGIDYTFELLEASGRRFTYDVFFSGTQPVILSRCKTTRKNGRVKP
jgi:hypothetical protein